MSMQQKSVTALIDDILKLVYDCPANHYCRSRLAAIRDGLFLELPEDRQSLLNRVGVVINESVPSGKTNCQIHDYWYEVRELWNEAVRPEKGFLQSSGDMDERWCDNCETDTKQECRDSTHERDSSGDYRKCLSCGWEYDGLSGEYHPPSQEKGL